MTMFNLIFMYRYKFFMSVSAIQQFQNEMLNYILYVEQYVWLKMLEITCNNKFIHYIHEIKKQNSYLSLSTICDERFLSRNPFCLIGKLN